MHSGDTGVSGAAFLDHDRGRRWQLELRSVAGGVADQTVEDEAVGLARGFGSLPITGHVADVNGRTLGGVGTHRPAPEEDPPDSTTVMSGHSSW